MPADGDHPLFRSYPETGEVTLSTGKAPVPYRVFDGHGVLVIGTGDIAAVSARFDGQDVHPVTTQSGEALIAMFVCDFHTASMGPHQELQITALAAPEPGQRISDNPSAFFAAFARQTDWGLLSLHLWNDTDPVLAFNTEFLGLDARRISGQIDLSEKAMTFDFADPEGAPIVAGSLAIGRKNDGFFMLRLLWDMGLSTVRAAARQDYATAFLINRKGAVLDRNRRARAMTATDNVVTRRFDPASDKLDLLAPALAAYEFVPRAMQFFNPFRFVYLHPDQS